MTILKNTMLKNLVKSTTNQSNEQNLLINSTLFKGLLQVVNKKKHTPLLLNSKYSPTKSKWKQQIECFNEAVSIGTEDDRFYYFDPKYGQGTYNTYKIKYASNNIFCHLFNNHGHTIHPAKSFGSYGIKVSKKNKQKHIKDFIQLYSNEIIAKKCIKKTITPVMVFNFEIKKRMRKRVIGWIKGMVIKKIPKRYPVQDISNGKHTKVSIKKKQHFIYAFKFSPLKAFNGCRGIIIRRKKRLYPHYKKKFIRS